MELKEIVISKASEHNLKSLNLSLPKNKLIVITGPSGSGKSSLAFDTIYAEGQRRYIESLSSYARQFLGQLPPAQVESISGLSPSIAIDQKSTNKNPRSTVGTVTEIYDYMRVLFARIGEKHCPECHDHLMPMSKEKMVQSLMALPLNSKLILLAPLVKNKKGQHKEILAQMISQGLSRFRLNGEIFLLEDLPEMKKTKSYSLEVVIDRIALKENSYQRLSDSIETALRISKGELIVLTGDKASDVLFFSEESNCKRCNISFPELAPNSFSFNSPLGACPHCNGLGTKLSFDPETMIESTELSLDEGAIIPLKRKNSFIYHMFKCVAKVEKINLHLPYKDLPEKIKKLIFYGSSDIYTYSFRTETSRFNFKKKFPGLIKWLDKRYHESESEKVRGEIENYLKLNDCSTCQGERLNAFSLAVTLPNSPYTISSLVKMPAQELLATLKKLSFEEQENYQRKAS